MRITLSRTGKIEYMQSVLTIESWTDERPDLLSILKFIDENGGVANKELLKEAIDEQVPSIVIDGIIRYLMNIGLLNPNYTLSLKSKKIIQSGLVPLEERGLFRLWFIKDPLLSNFVLHYERAKYQQKNGEDLYFDEYKSFLHKSFTSVFDTRGKEFRIKKFESENVPKVSLSSEMGSYKLQWTIDLDREEQSELILSGEIQDFNNRRIFSNKKLSSIYQEDFKSFLIQIINQYKKEEMSWNSTLECLEVPYGILPEKDYINMKTKLEIPSIESEKYGHFNATEILDIPIRPINDVEAKKWLIELVRNFLSNKYVTRQELNRYLLNLLESKTFQFYDVVFNELMDESRLDVLLNELRNGTNRDAYWNLQTPIDLYINLDERYVIQNRRGDIPFGTQMSMRQFVDLIVDNDRPDILVFSSKYVLNPAQIKKFKLFVEAFREKGVKQVVLITSEKVEINHQFVRVETYDEVYAGQKFPHDRYFAYRSMGKWNLFKMSAELDQCRYDNYHEATIDTIGTWSDISFIQVKSDVFPEKLIEKLNAFKEVYTWS